MLITTDLIAFINTLFTLVKPPHPILPLK